MKNKMTVLLLLVVLVCASMPFAAQGAPMNTYTKPDLEAELAKGNMTKLWVTGSTMLFSKQGNKYVKMSSTLMAGDEVFVVDPEPVDGYVYVYYYRWGYDTQGTLTCYLTYEGYLYVGGSASSGTAYYHTTGSILSAVKPTVANDDDPLYGVPDPNRPGFDLAGKPIPYP